MRAPLVLDDESRVAALLRLGVLDQPPEPDLDGLTRLAVSVTGSAFGAINLLDSARQWQASVSEGPREICPRADSMCLHTVAAGHTVHVPDATMDLRFRHNPFVTGVRDSIRSYCAVPIRDVNGFAVGTLAVFDRRIRALSDAQVASMQDLAAQIEHLFDMRRQHVRLVTLLAEIDHATTHDPLTGLANRRALVYRSEHAMVRTRRTQQFPTLFLCNLDGFRAVNDTFGRESGDDVLREIGKRLRTTMRPADTVARLGGDEFGLLCEDLAIGDRRILAQRVRAAVMAPVVLPGAIARVGTSIGMAVAKDGQSFDSLLREAAENMQADKCVRRVSA